MRDGKGQRKGPLGFGFGVLLVLAIFVPQLSANSSGESDATTDTGDTGRALAEAAGCDLSQNDVAMNVGEFDYAVTQGEPIGVASVEDAVLSVAKSLAGDGLAVAESDLVSAASAASKDSNPIQIQVPGALISVQQWWDGTYSVTGVVLCA